MVKVKLYDSKIHESVVFDVLLSRVPNVGERILTERGALEVIDVTHMAPAHAIESSYRLLAYHAEAKVRML